MANRIYTFGDSSDVYTDTEYESSTLRTTGFVPNTIILAKDVNTVLKYISSGIVGLANAFYEPSLSQPSLGINSSSSDWSTYIKTAFTKSAGTSSKPIFFDNGKPVECKGTLFTFAGMYTSLTETRFNIHIDGLYHIIIRIAANNTIFDMQFVVSNEIDNDFNSNYTYTATFGNVLYIFNLVHTANSTVYELHSKKLENGVVSEVQPLTVQGKIKQILQYR